MSSEDEKLKRWQAAKNREFKRGETYKMACRFDSAASKVLASLTALDVYSMDEVEEIAQSPEGRQLYAPVRVARIREMLEQLYAKWGVEEARTIDAEPLIGPKSLDVLN